MRFRNQTLIFLLGGCSYVCLELLWRQRSHASMFLAGGSAFYLLGKLHQAKHHWPLLLQALAGSGVITAVELAAGLLFNRNYAVWDYRQCWLNYRGQICALFSIIWIFISILAFKLHDGLSLLLQKKQDHG